MHIVYLLGVIAFGQLTPSPQLMVLDQFEDISQWEVIVSDGVEARLSQDDGVEGKALRLDYDFQAGAGFCVVRRPIDLPLPENYRFSFFASGNAPSNDFEFKLVDPTGENVWWVKRRNVSFSPEWRRVAYKARHFHFAWGPAGDTPLKQVGSIEFAIAAGSGGKGSVLIDSLTFQVLPKSEPPAGPMAVTSSSVDPAAPPLSPILPATGELSWRCGPDDASPWIEVDFGQPRELGGVVLDWHSDDYATDYDLLLDEDGSGWRRVATVREGNGGRDYVRLPEAEGTRVRLAVIKTSRGKGVGLAGLQFKPIDFAETANAMFRTIAGESPRGWFPRYFLNEQTPWTVVGAAGDAKEALVSVTGAVEVDKLAFTLEPFIFTNSRLTTWADVRLDQQLAGGFIPVPTVTWNADGLRLEITALADGPPGRSILLIRYRLTNTGANPQKGLLAVAIRPFQVLPPWQNLNITGGTSTIESTAATSDNILVNGQRVITPVTRPSGFGASSFAQGDIVEYLAGGAVPARQSVNDPTESASAAMAYNFALGPGQAKEVVVAVPFHNAADAVPEMAEADAAAYFESRLKAVCAEWEAAVNRVTLRLPPSAGELVDTFKSTQAYILVNADGPAIQPGSRTYERSWIRDGALTSTAMLSTGHPELAKAFLDWYARYQYPNGKVPCVVDGRGPDPVDEHDSTGELIYALLKYYRFTGDRDFLERHLDAVVAGVDYIEWLRNKRMTPEFRDGPPDKRVCFGLVPESISHEGYSAKPMHSYWDSFFVLRGLKDATTIAEVLDRPDLAARFGSLRDAYRKSMYDSMRLAMEINEIDYIPGCAELGDFDATSTAVGVFPGGELGTIPEPQLTNTFERYYDFFTKRRDGELDWEAYTPYEVRLIGTFVRLGQPQRAHELLEFFLQHRRPAGFRHWAEVVWRDPQAPKFIGDMPHTWVGSDFVNAVRSMFVYERERDESLVLAAGVQPEWLESPGGVSIGDFPTEYGPLSYSMALQDGKLVMDLRGPSRLPPGGIVLRSPANRPIQSVTCDGSRQGEVTGQEVRLTGKPAHVILEF